MIDIPTCLLAASHHPVVLELQGIAIGRLLHEDGRPFREEDLAIYEKLSGLGRMPGSVRVNGPIAPHVRSIFRIHIAEGAPPVFPKDDFVQFEEFRLDALLDGSNSEDRGP